MADKTPVPPLDPATWDEDRETYLRVARRAHHVAEKALRVLEPWFDFVRSLDRFSLGLTWEVRWEDGDGDGHSTTFPIEWLFLNDDDLTIAIEEEEARLAAIEEATEAALADHAARRAEEQERVELARLREKYEGGSR